MATDSPFLDRFRKQGIEDKTILHLFSNLGLPLPQKGEYFTTSDGGALVAINEAGVLLRLGSRTAENPCHDIKHEAVIQPIVQLDHGNLHAEILPGLKLGSNYDDVHQLVERLKTDKLYFDDRMTKVENVGYLPDGRAVILDRNAMKPMPGYAEQPELQLPLSQLRHMLSREFKTSCPEPFGEVPQGNPAVFWQACAKMKEAGQLVCGWLDKKYEDVVHYHNHGQTSDVQKKSLTYTASIKKHWEAPAITAPQVISMS